MDVFEAIRGRRSVREYRDEPVPWELVERVLDAARWAPSGANLQPWKFVVVTDPDARASIGATAKFYFVKSRHVAEAPVLVACLADVRKSKWAIVDVSMAAQNLMLAAHALGLGTCFVGLFDEQAVRETLGVPDRYRVVGLVTLGFPAHEERVPDRLPLGDIVAREVLEPELLAARVRSAVRSGPFSVVDKVLRMVVPRRRRRG